MKRLFMTLVVLLVAVTAALAQESKPVTAGDKIVGTYKTLHDGVNSKIKIFKHSDGYRAQVIWVDNLKKEDGTIRTDEKNPDVSKRKTPADKIVLIDKVKYNAKKQQWDDGKIYEPTSGKVWTVTCSFENDKKLRVRGSFGPFGKSVYWTKID